MKTTSNIILNSLQIAQKTRRIAYQIYENNIFEKEIVLVGIVGNGFIFSKKIAKVLKEITPLNIRLCELKIDKKNPLNPITTSFDNSVYKNKSIVLVDDVLNSGSTLIFGIKHLLETPIKSLKTAVLVNRNHKKFPVKADFKGISLSTTVKEHITVVFSKNKDKAFLS